MNDDIRKSLFDIRQSSEEIMQFVDGMSFERFLADIKTQKAVERNFEIIGEALNRIKRDDSAVLQSITGHEKIIGMRNILAHGYDAVDEKILWNALKDHLPLLLAEVNTLI
ncbi:DUF86 domain-containing protein [Kamptonema cortianum]|nr:HepT-like ribonuclease domain-containing protein [Oscillatoria laete-virens]MDK3157900.1 DUF86 domain-containing protein [Kamptonema cortianum]MDL5046030.1 DUF86 domain-containing protein [Oscillatoria amoena NRMC-F 0135]MDL5052738.1 DUF86 domain-containing protein [Oscillatoria laete-virens NRMC-F 0139]